MEQQFILRLHKNLKNTINIKKAKFERVDDKRLNLIYNNQVYPGIIIKLPCVVESQKTLDHKQYYKICDISIMVVIYPDTNIDFEQERRILELSGISTPMKYVKSRRFKKTASEKAQMVNEVEQKVNDLLEKDKKAIRVEILNNKMDEDEILDIATEIESSFKNSQVSMKEIKEVKEESPEIIELRKDIKQQEELVTNALNPILKQRFKSRLDILKKKLEDMIEKLI